MNTSKLKARPAPLVLLLAVLLLLAPGAALAEYVGNLGPNTQTPGAPANPVVQSIHPK